MPYLPNLFFYNGPIRYQIGKWDLSGYHTGRPYRRYCD